MSNTKNGDDDDDEVKRKKVIEKRTEVVQMVINASGVEHCYELVEWAMRIANRIDNQREREMVMEKYEWTLGYLKTNYPEYDPSKWNVKYKPLIHEK